MSECCSSQNPSKQYPKRHQCPVNGQNYGAVGTKTLLHHIRNPWSANLKEQGYYFCTDPKCQVVYFGQDNSVITKSELRTRVGQKETRQDRPVCYCFGVSRQDAEMDTSIKDYVVQTTKDALCSCETSNPSGKCCLKDFPQPK